MRSFIASTVFALGLLVVNGLTAPVISNITQCADARGSWAVTCAEASRQLSFCDNPPGFVAKIGPAVNPTLTSRQLALPNSNSSDRKNLTLCKPQDPQEPQIDVFIVPTFGTESPAVETLLGTALENIQRTLNRGVTGSIPVNGWRILGPRATTLVVDPLLAHPATYEMLLLATGQLIDWMRAPEMTFGSCTFEIWNGGFQVGEGRVLS